MSSSPLIRIVEPETPRSWQGRLDLLRRDLAGYSGVVVAYSGGVDSSLVLRVAVEVLGDRALGVIGRSDSYAERELRLALDQAAAFGARVEVVATGELADPAFRSNPLNRCYHCKTELYRKLAAVRERVGADVVLDGTIADDLTDWRPGRQAASERGVRSPLADLGFAKQDVRAAAASLGLESHDKPASPCLASRIPYGTEITRDNLRQVEEGEELIRSLGFRIVRVRHHGELARIEVPLEDLDRLIEVRDRVSAGLESVGFRFVAVDLKGFRSGSLNPAKAGDFLQVVGSFARSAGGSAGPVEPERGGKDPAEDSGPASGIATAGPPNDKNQGTDSQGRAY